MAAPVPETATVPEIRVFAMFPLNLKTHRIYEWVHLLTFPINTLIELQLSSKPYKWIQYATGVIVGVKGDLSLNSNSPHPIDYEKNLPQQGSTSLYYHMSDDERRRMLPADTMMSRPGYTSSRATTRREEFRRLVIERDGRCVLTNNSELYCDAAHLLPHSKGDDYIRNYTQGRSRDDEGRDVVFGIDDPRNGILLNPTTHRALGKAVAFLMTPNFAMTTTDVDPTASPTEKRCTAHLFDPDQPEALGDRTISSGDLVRMPNAADEWPPNILFDAVYADVVLHHFAPGTLEETLKKWRSKYYIKGITSAAQASHQAATVEKAARGKMRHEQDLACNQRAAKRKGQAADDRGDSLDNLMILPYILIPPEMLDEYLIEAEEERAEREQKLVRDKVVGWRLEVANACS